MRKSEEQGPRLTLFYVALAAVAGLWLLNLFLLHGYEAGERGTFGDMFGAVNSVFSGAAFAGVVYAILLQRFEVSIAREELSRTKEILAEQGTALKKQNDSNETKSFEDTFFQLLSLHNEIISSMDLSDGSKVTSGRDVFPAFWRRLGNKFEWDYEKFYKGTGSELGHYFRMLYNIIKFVDEAAPGDKKFYSNLVRAQISDTEAAMLYINGLSSHGFKFKPLIEKYHLLKHVKEKEVRQSTLDPKAYAPGAYSKSNEYPAWVDDAATA